MRENEEEKYQGYGTVRRTECKVYGKVVLRRRGAEEEESAFRIHSFIIKN